MEYPIVYNTYIVVGYPHKAIEGCIVILTWYYNKVAHHGASIFFKVWIFNKISHPYSDFACFLPQLCLQIYHYPDNDPNLHQVQDALDLIFQINLIDITFLF